MIASVQINVAFADDAKVLTFLYFMLSAYQCNFLSFF